jgi:hypothetical protein
VIGALVLAGYLLMWLITAGMITRVATKDFGDADPIDRFMCAGLGMITGLFWPLAFPIMLIRWIADMESPAERRERRAIEKDRRVQELQFKIRRLERELGIGQERAS